MQSQNNTAQMNGMNKQIQVLDQMLLEETRSHMAARTNLAIVQEEAQKINEKLKESEKKCADLQAKLDEANAKLNPLEEVAKS